MNYVIEFKTSVTNPDEPEDWEGSVVVSAEDISDAQDKVEDRIKQLGANITSIYEHEELDDGHSILNTIEG